MKYFLDCGSNLGQGFTHFRNIYGDGYQYLLFEPNVNCYEKLVENFNILTNVTIFNAAVYTSDCVKTFRFDSSYSVGGTLVEQHNSAFPKKQEEVAVRCIDIIRMVDTIISNGNEVVMKLDVESSEYDILEKMIETKTINKIKKIYCEFHTQYMIPEDRKAFLPRENSILNYIRENKLDFEIWH